MAKSHLVEQLLLSLKGRLPTPAQEVRFHPTRKWRFDLAWKDIKLAVEVDGGVYSGGRHVRGDGYTKDCEKLNEAAILGWVVVRVTGEMVEMGMAAEQVVRAYIARGGDGAELPTPNPLTPYINSPLAFNKKRRGRRRS